MPITIDEVRAHAMGLPPEEREALAMDLLDSVDEIDEVEVDDSVAAMIAERSAAMHRGELETQDWKESVAELHQWMAEHPADRS